MQNNSVIEEKHNLLRAEKCNEWAKHTCMKQILDKYIVYEKLVFQNVFVWHTDTFLAVDNLTISLKMGQLFTCLAPLKILQSYFFTFPCEEVFSIL